MSYAIAPPRGRTIDHKTREPATSENVLNPSNAQIQYFLACMKRDHGDFGMRDMEKIERITRRRSESKLIYNPFSGQVDRIRLRNLRAADDYFRQESY